MAFSSLFFVLFFLPIFVAFYYYSKTFRAKQLILLVASLIFYTFGGVRYLLLLILMSAVGYYAGFLIERARTPERKRLGKIISVAIFLAVLAIFKYTGFFLGTIGAIVRADWVIPQIALPLGISFYTFKLISYVVDVSHERIRAEKDPLIFLTYTSIFHQVSQGPIVRYGDMQKALHGRRMTHQGMANGIYRFCIGLGKKAILANHCGVMADALIPMSEQVSQVPAAGIWLGAICYMLQIYLDFSAYSDMALGLGEMIGFRYPENFYYPYVAVSVRDFWRRWHISLSSFFRDYVYIPLGGNREGERRTMRNLLVVWALTGLWHGASWNYVLWGLYFFGFIVWENRRAKQGRRPFHPVVQHLLTLLILCVSWVIFRFENVAHLGRALTGMLGLQRNGFTGITVSLMFKNNVFFLIYAVVACTPVFLLLEDRIEGLLSARKMSKMPLYIGKTVIAILLLIFSMLAMAGNTFQPFLYNQF